MYLGANQFRNGFLLGDHGVEVIHIIVEEAVRTEGRRIVAMIAGAHLVPERVTRPVRFRRRLLEADRDCCHNAVGDRRGRHIKGNFDLHGFVVLSAGAQDANGLGRLLCAA